MRTMSQADQSQTFPPRSSSEPTYANKVAVERGEHDAVLRFYRSREGVHKLVKEITVPLGVLDGLAVKEEVA
jgi:hypothetical protein